MTSALAQPRTGPDRQIIILCDCVGACECLFVAEWDDGEGNEHWQNFEFYSSYRVDHWRQRLKSAWLALRGKQPFYHSIVTTPEQGRELGEWLLAKTGRTYDITSPDIYGPAAQLPDPDDAEAA